MMKTKILFISQVQFGYLTDIYKYVEYLKDEFQITVISFDEGLCRYELNGVEFIYLKSNSSVEFRSKLYRQLFNLLHSQDFSFVFLNYFRGVSMLFRLLSNYNCLLDFRTVDVNKSFVKRFIYNKIMFIESLFFKHKSVITERVRQQLSISKDCLILPLGADICLQDRVRHSNIINLLYVGTFNGRKLSDTIRGISLFLKKNNIELYYTIIGKGSKSETKLLRDTILELDLEDKISLVGYVKNNELTDYMLSSDIGVSYVPITEAYNFQPPTKTFEYLAHGLPVLATDTCANNEIINEYNGVLIDDSPEAFAYGLESLFSRLAVYDENKIKNSVGKYTYKEIAFTLREYIDSFL